MGSKFIGMQPKKQPHRFWAATGPLFEGDGMTQEAASELLHLLIGAAGLIGVDVSLVAVSECDIDGHLLREPDTSEEVMAQLMGQIVRGPDDAPTK